MKVIVAGSRYYNPGDARRFVKRAINASGWIDSITEIVHGCCNVADDIPAEIATGIDAAAEYMCSRRWSIKRFPAVWRPNGLRGAIDRSAGPRRNAEMVAYADAL